MKKVIFISIALVTSFVRSTFAAELGEDPFKKIEHITLSNGLQVYLAPSAEATTTAVRLEVGVGWEAEHPGNYGVSHLLEHVLFRDKQLKDEMTYLQLIREAGGEANGSTTRRATSYFGSIPSKKGPWLLESFGKMILEPSIHPEYVQKEKGTVELERGRPGPVAEMLGFNPMDYIYPSYLREPSVWESEFGLSYNEPYTVTQEQLSTRRLQTEHLSEHYERYYYPSNMKLFVAGKFDRNQIMAEINNKWATLPNKSGDKLPPEKDITPKDQPYIRQVVWSETPYVYIGTKAWGMSAADIEIARSYTGYLAHRLMKDIRNIKGQTYSANNWDYFYKGFGYGGIQFQTQKENLKENIQITKSHIQSEAREAKFSEDEMKAAVDLYLSKYALMGRDAEKMMRLALDYDDIVEQYGKFVSPVESLHNISSAEYNKSLQKTFAANHSYEYLYTPPLFFMYDTMVMYFLVAVFSFVGLRKLLTKPFANDQIRWVRKVKYPPMKIVEGIGVVIAYFGVIHAQLLLSKMFLSSNFIQSHILLSNYVQGALWMLTVLLIAQGVYSFMPRKLMVVGDKLLIKSVTYYSKKISLSEVDRVESVRVLGYPFPLRRWVMKVGLRFFYVNPLFWQKGLMIHMKDGKSYFFSVASADKASAELSGFLSKSVDETPVQATDAA